MMLSWSDKVDTQVQKRRGRYKFKTETVGTWREPQRTVNWCQTSICCNATSGNQCPFAPQCPVIAASTE